jgi:polysaccharide biosynthesis/export protein
MRIRLLACLLAALAAIGCATEQPFVWVSSVPAPDMKPDGVIRPRDSIVVVVRDHGDLSGEFVVRDDGGILYPNLPTNPGSGPALSTISDIHVGGLTTEAATSELRARASSLVVNPVVTVGISRLAPIKVNVVGEVKTPAAYELTRDRTVAAALAAAGWLTEYADRERIFVVRHEGGTRIRFRASEITSPDPAVARFRLSDGDVVVAE